MKIKLVNVNNKKIPIHMDYFLFPSFSPGPKQYLRLLRPYFIFGPLRPYLRWYTLFKVATTLFKVVKTALFTFFERTPTVFRGRYSCLHMLQVIQKYITYLWNSKIETGMLCQTFLKPYFRLLQPYFFKVATTLFKVVEKIRWLRLYLRSFKIKSLQLYLRW